MGRNLAVRHMQVSRCKANYNQEAKEHGAENAASSIPVRKIGFE